MATRFKRCCEQLLMPAVLCWGGTILIGSAIGCGDETHEECEGFVVAGDGQVKLVGLHDAPMGGAHGMGEEAEDAHAQDHSMHVHGLCVSISDDASSAETRTTDGALRVSVMSLRGILSTDAPDLEGLSLSIEDDDGVPLTSAMVVLKARMPHHDRNIPGGHGPRNDMMVTGLPATETSNGIYVVDPIDFQMTKYWFFEVEITTDDETRRAYFAMEVAATGD